MDAPSRSSGLPRLPRLIAALALFTALFLGTSGVRAESHLLVATYDGVINPVAAEYIHDALASAEAGDAQIGGHSVRREPDAVRNVIGFMPDTFGVYDDMRVWEYLDFFGACYKIPANVREKTVLDVLELVGLSEKKGALIGAALRLRRP